MVDYGMHVSIIQIAGFQKHLIAPVLRSPKILSKHALEIINSHKNPYCVP